MLVTVIIPLYNRQQYVELAIQSLLRQEADFQLDIVVVNDGSTDDGPNRIEALAKQYPQIRMISVPNRGVAKARNIGLANLLPKTDFVTFLDSDDISPADRFTSDLAAFAEMPTLQFTYGQMTIVDQIDETTYEPPAESSQVTVRGISLSAAIFRASFVRGLGTIDETFEQAEDADYLFRAFETGQPYQQTDTICVFYRQHGNNMTSDRATLRKSIMRALHRSATRRRNNPSLRLPKQLFNLQTLSEYSPS